MTPETLAAIRAHAVADYPRECAGLVLVVKGRERYLPCSNTAHGTDHFILPAEEYAAAEEQGEIIAIVHSHSNAPARPSAADKVACEASGLPWHIVSVGMVDDAVVAGELATIEPCGYQAPLVGRPFHHGVLDCYALIRDWYQRERGITLPDYPRNDGWWNDGHSNLYMELFADAGFVILPQDMPSEIGDVIYMQIRAKNGVPNHAGVYIGDGMMLHHLHGRLSSRDYYGGMWADYTRAILRYQPNAAPNTPTREL